MRKRLKYDKALTCKDYLNETDQSKPKRPNLCAGELETPHLTADISGIAMLRSGA
jgi:hypothetical protein